MNIENYKVGGTNFEIGFFVGSHFKDIINETFDNHEGLHREILPYHRSDQGQEKYNRLIKIHEKEYPAFMDELKGMAKGSDRSFEELFLMNMRGEYARYIKVTELKGCSTASIITEKKAIFGHNEDGLEVFKGKLFLVNAAPKGKPEFTALTYPGFISGNAFGFNNNGICFAINNVHPDYVTEGIGRHFIARSLFETSTIEQAISKITRPGRASGFNYTLASVKERRIVNVEVTADQHSIRELQGAYFHTNHYIELQNIDQTITPTSMTRLKRAKQIFSNESIYDKRALLKVLSDRKDNAYPVYRNNIPPDDRITLMTCVFDLDKRSFVLYDKIPFTEINSKIKMPIGSV
jgi:predicted choloylglycine hydrolase